MWVKLENGRMKKVSPSKLRCVRLHQLHERQELEEFAGAIHKLDELQKLQ